MRNDDAIAATAAAPTGLASVQGDNERLPAGSMAGDYEITSHLGSGAMGDVYAGCQPVIGKKVAIKVIKRRLADSDEAVQRFVREAQAVNKVDHPNVTDVFNFGRLDDGRLFLVMELLEGESLGDRIRRDGALDPQQMMDVLEPICDALAAAHRKSVIHRDLKPDNVFLAKAQDHDARVYVLDFGIAKILSDVSTDTSSGTLTGDGVWMGTPAYMAPEQWCSEAASAATDIYALGAMVFQMLTGKLPYSAKSVPGIMEQHFHAEVPALSTMRGVTLPSALDDVLRKAMAKKPEDRFSSSIAFRDAVRDALAGISVAGNRRATPLAHKDHHGPQLPWLAVALGAGLMAAGVVAFVLLRGGGSAAEPRHEAAGPAGDTVRVHVVSVPRGARILYSGNEVGVTPFAIDAEPDVDVTVQLSKPGYGSVVRSIKATSGAQLSVTLPVVKQFEGVWRLPEGTLRAFKRHNERVAGYSLKSIEAEATFLRFFEFRPVDGMAVAFGAAAEHVDERAPNAPSCRIGLRAQYRYAPSGDRLELRREKLSYEFKAGKCIVHSKRWGPYERLARLANASNVTLTAVASRAGAGPLIPLTAVNSDRRADSTQRAKQTKSKPKRANKATLGDSQRRERKQAAAKSLEQDTARQAQNARRNKAKRAPPQIAPQAKNAANRGTPVPKSVTKSKQQLNPAATKK